MARKKKKKLPYWLYILIIIVVILGSDELKSFIGLKTDQEKIERPFVNTDMGQLEIPSMPKGKQGQVIQRTGYTLAYDKKTKTPQWVAWELTKEETKGNHERTDKFLPDPNVEGAKVATTDYTGSGYDRGHMAPAGDMKWDKTAMEETFCLTNIAPQDGSLNRGTWKKIEEKCRARVVADSAIVIVCGPVLSEAPREFIGDSRVAVPQRFFKVILSPWAKTPQAIGFLVDNGAVPGGMQAAAVTVDEIEALTGHDFFSTLPDSIEASLESKINFTRWSRLK